MKIRKSVEQVTNAIIARSQIERTRYLKQLDLQNEKGVQRGALSCGNLAHGFAACGPSDKAALAGTAR